MTSRTTLLLLSVIMMMMLVIFTSSFTSALMQRRSNLTFFGNSKLNFFSTSVISPATVANSNAFAVFASYTQPTNLVKVALGSATDALTSSSWIANISLNAGEDYVRCSVLSPDGSYALFGTETSPTSHIIKVNMDVGSASLTRVSRVTLSNAGESPLWSAVMNPNSFDSLWGSWQSPGRVIKIRNSDLVPQGTLTLASGEDKLQSASITPDGSVALFGCWTLPGRVVKVQVSTLTRMSALILNSGENFPVSSVMSIDGSFALFGMDTSDIGRIVKVRVIDLTRQAGLSLTSNEIRLASAAMHISGSHAYFCSASAPGVVSKISLVDPNAMFLESTTTLDAGENFLWTAEIGQSASLNSDVLYAATYTQPASVVQLFTAVTTTTTTTTTSTTTQPPLNPTVTFTTDPVTTSTTATPVFAPTNSDDDGGSSLSGGAIAGIVLGSLALVVILALIFVPILLGQPGWCCATFKACGACCKNDEGELCCAEGTSDEAVEPHGPPKFHHPHIQAKMREMLFVEQQIAKKGGTYFPEGAGDDSIFSTGSPINVNKLTPEMRRKVMELEREEEEERRRQHINSHSHHNNSNKERRSSISPTSRKRVDSADSVSPRNMQARGRGFHTNDGSGVDNFDINNQNRNLSVTFPFEDANNFSPHGNRITSPYQYQQALQNRHHHQHQSEVAPIPPIRFNNSNNSNNNSENFDRVSPMSWTRGVTMEEPTSYNNSNHNNSPSYRSGGGIEDRKQSFPSISPSRQQQQRNPYTNDTNTQYYYYSNTTPPRKNVLPRNEDVDDPNLLPLPDAHRARDDDENGGDGQQIDAITVNSWATPSGRTYGNVRSPNHQNQRNNINNNNSSVVMSGGGNRNYQDSDHYPPASAVAANQQQFQPQQNTSPLPPRHQSRGLLPTMTSSVSSPSAANYSYNRNRQQQQQQNHQNQIVRNSQTESPQQRSRGLFNSHQGARNENDEDQDRYYSDSDSDLSHTQSPSGMNNNNNNNNNNRHYHDDRRVSSSTDQTDNSDVRINRFSPAAFYRRQREEAQQQQQRERSDSPSRITQQWR